MDWVRHDSWVTERVAGTLGVCVPRVRIAMSLLHGALRPRGGGGVSDNRRGHAGGCVVTKLMARQRVQKGNTCRDWLLHAGGERYRNRWIREGLIWHIP